MTLHFFRPPPLSGSPDLALLPRVHGRPRAAAEVPAELGHVGEGAPHPEHVGRVHAGQDLEQQKRFGFFSPENEYDWRTGCTNVD